MTAYLELTKDISNAGDGFVFRWIAKDAPISTDTVRNICSNAMRHAGIPKRFASHSLRMAAASKLLDEGMSIEDVMRLGDWTSTLVFTRFYNRSKYRSDTAELLSGRSRHEGRMR